MKNTAQSRGCCTGSGAFRSKVFLELDRSVQRAVVDRVTDVESEGRDVMNVANCRLRDVEVVPAGVAIPGDVAGVRYSTVEGVEDGKAGPVENDGDDAVKMAFVSGSFVKEQYKSTSVVV